MVACGFAADLHAGMRLREGLSVRYSGCPKVRKSLKITLCDVPMCNKQITVMKKFFRMVTALSLVAGVLAFTGCTDYEDDINALDERLTAVESTVSELQSAIDGGAVITNVESTADGITITLSNGKTYDVTNGKDGADGAAGEHHLSAHLPGHLAERKGGVDANLRSQRGLRRPAVAAAAERGHSLI